ncbi:TetR family transcriptional regulator C-terminal domain-containing protein [Robiginitalea marina]|uniref:TetR family transcriptional regulator C-terminal domain-containing protein n=1 Tax=Robiginitalea marina TaxID=2954105 RepID=A0ABT1B1L4_9FLAO|nr:TetR family transcriptional regulator C-terminal domain-containing protein [Robiginitalea marina]MCO5725498.1 TetR family transcriptional regulator C-terminal domain-containing protein [Robiginitalea marina]
MSPKKKPEISTGETLVAAYMSDTLEREKFPVSVYRFCKDNALEESEFYKHFGSLEALQKEIWVSFYDKTLGLLREETAYDGYAPREKMLGFFFTFFELLTLNRSYVLFALKQGEKPLERFSQLSGLRTRIRGFARELVEQGNEERSSAITRHSPALFSEGAWLQFMFLLQFWMKDGSPSFEKTDMAIEKSVNTIFDVFDNTPLERVLDFGKFLYKEHFA